MFESPAILTMFTRTSILLGMSYSKILQAFSFIWRNNNGNIGWRQMISLMMACRYLTLGTSTSSTLWDLPATIAVSSTWILCTTLELWMHFEIVHSIMLVVLCIQAPKPSCVLKEKKIRRWVSFLRIIV